MNSESQSLTVQSKSKNFWNLVSQRRFIAKLHHWGQSLYREESVCRTETARTSLKASKESRRMTWSNSRARSNLQMIRVTNTPFPGCSTKANLRTRKRILKFHLRIVMMTQWDSWRSRLRKKNKRCSNKTHSPSTTKKITMANVLTFSWIRTVKVMRCHALGSITGMNYEHLSSSAMTFLSSRSTRETVKNFRINKTSTRQYCCK